LLSGWLRLFTADGGWLRPIRAQVKRRVAEIVDQAKREHRTSLMIARVCKLGGEVLIQDQGAGGRGLVVRGKASDPTGLLTLIVQ